ncbi:acyltransferase [Limosilactobacillus sp.]|uniref:acyltransferase n=1 Tax=Limosilactobacillus sp. TaxID=2773925 RepID=UPI003F014440
MKKSQFNIKKRKSNFELLRIIAMFFIVMHHSLVHGVLAASNSAILSRSNPLSLSLFNSLAFMGKVGVYLFVLITGYFMYNSHISFKKLVKLWLPIFFWSVSLTLICGIILKQISIISIVKSCLPIFFNQYWFMTAYVFMYLLIPFMNKALAQLNPKEEIFLVLLGFILIFPGKHLYGAAIVAWLGKFCLTFCFGALIQKRNLLQSRYFIFVGKVLFWLGVFVDVLFSLTFSFLAFKLYKPSFIKYSKLSDQGLTIFAFFTALGLFIWLGSKAINYNYIINTVASTTFGIYLIHDNRFMESLLWLRTLHMEKVIMQPAYVAVLYVLFICIAVFVICSLLEYIRKRVFNKLEDQVSSWANTKLTRLITSQNNRISQIRKSSKR